MSLYSARTTPAKTYFDLIPQELKTGIMVYILHMSIHRPLHMSIHRPPMVVEDYLRNLGISWYQFQNIKMEIIETYEAVREPFTNNWVRVEKNKRHSQ